LPPNLTLEPITIDRIDLSGVDGIDVIGLVLNDPTKGRSIGGALGFPPQDTHTIDPHGAIFPPQAEQPWTLEVFVGVRLSEGRTEGTLQAIKLRYTAGGVNYEVVLPYSLTVTTS
jgi:hypothetical protein